MKGEQLEFEWERILEVENNFAIFYLIKIQSK